MHVYFYYKYIYKIINEFSVFKSILHRLFPSIKKRNVKNKKITFSNIPSN